MFTLAMTSAYREKRNTMTRIIDLSNKEAQKFLMQPDQYCTTELPEYFDFAPMLSYCQKQIGEKSWGRILTLTWLAHCQA